MEDLPTVSNNLVGMQEALHDPAIWGVPEANFTIISDSDLADPLTAQQLVAEKLNKAAKLATDALVIYYAGHGLIDSDNLSDELYLALPASDRDRAYSTALPYDWIRRALAPTRTPAKRKVVILDCCYAGRALARLQGGAAQVAAGQLEIAGSYILTATAATRPALSPEGEPYTGFTGALISILADGLPTDSPTLDMDTLFIELARRLQDKGLPGPQRAELSGGGTISLVRNRQAGTLNLDAGFSTTDVRYPSVLPIKRAINQDYPPPKWLDRIDSARALTVASGVKPDAGTAISVLAIFLIPVIAGWAAVALFTPLRRADPAWLIAVNAPALAALAGFLLLRGKLKWWVVVPLVTANIGLSIAWIVDGAGNWGLRGLIVALLGLQLMSQFFMEVFSDELRQYQRIRRRWADGQAAGEIASNARWLTASSQDKDLDLLAAIPGARFAQLSDTHLSFLSVAGKKVLLIAFAKSSAAFYERLGEKASPAISELSDIALDTQQWRKFLEPVHALVQPLLLVHYGVAADESELRIQDYNGIMLTTPGTFAEKAGFFLAEDPYSLDLDVLGQIHVRLRARKNSS